MRRFATVLTLLTLFAVTAVGCQSQQQAMADAATPIGTKIHDDMQAYLLVEDPPNTARVQVTNDFLIACQAGNKADIVLHYYGTPPDHGVRSWYVTYLNEDPKYTET